MKSFKFKFILVCFWLTYSYSYAAFAQSDQYDVVVYGATAGGVITAIAAANEGASVLLLEPGQHVGGMLTGGLSHTDFGDRAVIGGLAIDFYQKVAEHYGTDLYFWRGPEPKVGEQILRDWLRKSGVEVIYGQRVGEVEKEKTTINRITMLSGKQYQGRIFADATYEGDLLAKAGVSYTVGREGVAQYGESWAGRQPLSAPSHNFLLPVSPFVDKSRDKLLPLIHKQPLVPVGEADAGVQAYCFRLIMTNNSENRIPITRPEDYDSARYELLRRYMYALKPQSLRETQIFHPTINLPNGKAEINSAGAISTNLSDGSNWAYPDADYPLRDSIWQDHISYTRGLLYFTTSDKSLPESVKDEAKEWGFCKDEFADTQYFPHQLYVREARRMRGEYVLTQHDMMSNVRKYDGIGMGSYNMDVRHVQRTYHWVSHFPELAPEIINEGYMSIPVKPYEIPYRALLPKYEECSNLIVPVCLSSSSLGYSSFRMEPQYMIAGHAAGVAAAMAAAQDQELHKLNTVALQEKLKGQGQIISFDDSPNGFFEKDNTVIVDDDMSRFVEKEGPWWVSEDPTVGRHDITFLRVDSEEEARVFYQPYLPKTGTYKLYGWWPKLKNAASAVPITLETGNSKKTMTVDQASSGDTWVYLGTFEGTAGRHTVVTISNQNTEGSVSADAFKFEWQP